MNQLGCASGCCVFFSWPNTKKISRLFSDILFDNSSSPPLLNFSWTDLWSTSHFLVWQCWSRGLLQVAFMDLRAPVAFPPGPGRAALTGRGPRAQCAGAAARGQPPAARGAPGGAGTGKHTARSQGSTWQAALSVKTTAQMQTILRIKVIRFIHIIYFRGPLFSELLHLFLIGVAIIELFNLFRCTWFMTRLLVGCAQLLLAPEAVLSVCSVVGSTQSEYNSKNSKNLFVNR